MEENSTFLLHSVIVAAENINGDLKEVAFKKFLKRTNELLVELGCSDPNKNFEINIYGTFVRTVYQKSSDTEKRILAFHVHHEVTMVSKLIELTSSFWKGEIPMVEELTSGMCSLLALVLDTWKYGSQLKTCLQGDAYLVALITSLEIYLRGADLCSLTQDSITCTLLQYSLEILCLCADDSSLCIKYLQSGCLQLAQKLVEFPRTDVRVTSKALAGLVIVECQDVSTRDMIHLSDEEMAVVLDIFQSETESHIYISECAVVIVLKGLISNERNVEEFKQHKLSTLLEQNRKWKSSLMDEIIVQLTGSTKESITDTSQNDDTVLNDVTKAFVSSCTMTPSSEDEEDTLSSLIAIFTEYFVKYITLLDSSESRQLTANEFNNITASLLLLEELLFKSNDIEQEKIKSIITKYPDIAKAASILIEHLHDEGTNPIFQQNALRSIIMLMMDLTDYSSQLCKELGLSGFVAYLLAFLETLSKTTLLNEEGDVSLVLLILVILLNCASEFSNLPVFEAANTAERLIPFIQGPYFDIAMSAKMILSFLTPCLTNEEFLLLELEPQETEHLISMFSEALSSPDMRAEGSSIEEVLKFLINFTKPLAEDQRKDDGQIKKKALKTSVFQINYAKRKQVFQNNVQSCVNVGILTCIESLLVITTVDSGSVIMEYALQLLWNLLHLEYTINMISTSLREVLNTLQSSSSSAVKSLVICVQLLLKGLDDCDISLGLQYAQTCYMYGYFQQCATVCDSIKTKIGSQLKPGLSDLAELDLLYGKAMYHCYQPELWHLIKRGTGLSQEEMLLVSDECFKKMKTAISRLGTSLDRQHIDSDGSKLLDLAMAACALDLNRLNHCNRCLLCRRGGQKLKKSHLWPNSILKRIYKANFEGEKNPFLFGLQQNRPKTSKECTFSMFCHTCEKLLSQNGEDQFAKLLDIIQNNPREPVSYGSWLYDFAMGMIFRQLATESMSYFVNSQEVYNTFLLCRKHLFTLKTKIGTNTVLLSDLCSYQADKMHTEALGDVSIYVMRCHAKLASYKDEMIHYFSEFSHCFSSVATCRLLDAKLDLSGCVHFLEVYCEGIHFLLKFKASENCFIPDKYLIAPTSVIPTDDLASIPEGVWSVLRHSGAIAFESRMESYQAMSEMTIQNFASPASLLKSKDEQQEEVVSHGDLEILHLDYSLYIRDSGPGACLLSPSLYSFSFLPKEYVIGREAESIQLPEGHKIVWHFTGQMDELLMTYFLCTDGKDFYIILVNSDAKSELKLIEGFHLSTKGEAIHVTQFLLENRPGLEKLPHPFSLEELQFIINEQFPTLLCLKGFKNMSQLVHLLECRRSIESPRSIPSLDFKCFPGGCWYCRSLCHCCMFPVSMSEGKTIKQEPDKPLLLFCSEKCQQLVYPEPGAPPIVSVTYHKSKPGKIVGPAKLQILKSMVPEGDRFSQLEFIELCIKTDPDDSDDGIPIGKPYVVWQICSSKEQKFMDFFISDSFEPTECLWMSSFSQLNVSFQDPIVRGRICDLMKNVLELVLNKIGFTNLDSFVASNMQDASYAQ